MSATLQQPQPDYAELQQAASRLTKTVSNLLDATRLESGLLQPVREWCDPGELLGEAVRDANLDHAVEINVEENLPLISVDGRLIQQALAALLTNSAAYSPPGTPIEATVRQEMGNLYFDVADRGPGLAPGEETRAFEKFYRGAGKPAGGLGLGLAIAKQLVEVHGGSIRARNLAIGGACFTIRLPIGKPMELPMEAS
jgi:two-component system sensor histidine kinase KdpD